MRTVAHVSALRPAKDSVNWQAIPVGTAIVAGYVSPSHFAWPAAAWARFAGSIEVRITPSASVTGKGIQVLDIEPGDASAGQAPGWVRAQRALGQEPTPYCSMANWPSVIRAINAAGLVHPPYWVAGYPGGGPILPSIAVDGQTYTATAHQYADPNTSGGDYDLSVVAPYWPGVDGGTPDMPLTSDDVNAIWSGPVWAVLAAGSPEAAFAVAVLGVTPNQDGSVTIKTNSAGAWLSVSSVRVAMLEQQVAEVQTALVAQQTQEATDVAAVLAAVQAIPAGTVDPTAVAAALVAAGLPADLVTALLAVLTKAAAN